MDRPNGMSEIDFERAKADGKYDKGAASESNPQVKTMQAEPEHAGPPAIPSPHAPAKPEQA